MMDMDKFHARITFAIFHLGQYYTPSFKNLHRFIMQINLLGHR